MPNWNRIAIALIISGTLMSACGTLIQKLHPKIEAPNLPSTDDDQASAEQIPADQASAE